MFAEVIVDLSNYNVDKVFDYIIPKELSLKKGSTVFVPFGHQKVKGYVVNIKETSSYDINKLKRVLSVDNKIVLSEELLELCKYLKESFYLKMIDCIRVCVPTVVRKGLAKHLINNIISLNTDKGIVEDYLNSIRKNAYNQIGIIKHLQNVTNENIISLNKKFGASSVKKLLQDKIIISNPQQVKRNSIMMAEQTTSTNVTLTPEQSVAVDTILKQNAKTLLLHGVTGSGKTEVYLRAIEAVIGKGKTAIMLVPEISLTPIMMKRFTQRFGDKVAVLHSGLSGGEKFDEWKRIYQGEAKVVVGARSAIFAPLQNLGVIIIDEEHDSSYVSDSNPRYITKDVAEFRSKFNNCPLVLGSATPSIDTYYQTFLENYKLIELPQRINKLDMPTVEIVDMLPEFRSGNKSPFSSALITHVNRVVNTNTQAIIFINRRGYSSFLMCRDCGYVPHCEHCDVTLTYHKSSNELKCHYCGARYKVITHCPKCSSQNIKLGGVGTEQVVSRLQEMYPSVKIFRMDNDTTNNKNAHAKILNEFEKTKPAILVGTQMIAKGHDFPLVTLVGILDADLSLYFGGYLATEKTYQLITQVAGRAGRKDLTGHVVLQTYYPKHYVYKMVANYDYKRFYDKELNLRRVAKFLPFSKMIRLLISSEQPELAQSATAEAFESLKQLKNTHLNKIYFLEAMKSPVNKIKNKFRYQIIIRFSDNEDIIKTIYSVSDNININKNISCFVEVNPQNLT